MANTIYILTARSFCDDDLFAYATREAAEIAMMQMAQAVADNCEESLDDADTDCDYSGNLISMSLCDITYLITPTALHA